MKKLSQEEWEAGMAWSKVVAGCVVRRGDGKYLLVQEKQEHVYGLWNIPAGHVDKGETIEHAAVREVKEESGYEVELTGKIAVYHETVESAVKHAFRATVIGGKLKAQPEEILAARWFSYDEITRLKTAAALRGPGFTMLSRGSRRQLMLRVIDPTALPA